MTKFAEPGEAGFLNFWPIKLRSLCAFIFRVFILEMRVSQWKVGSLAFNAAQAGLLWPRQLSVRDHLFL